ncbi:MAG: hydrolase 2, exosortase A system-associated [Pseudomonadota bacterium]
MSDFEIRPFFLEGEEGRLFTLLYMPPKPQQAVVFVPPFAEEMNKCRQQVSRTAQALVKNDCAVLIVDLFGTGDSQGDFSGATWNLWKADLETAMRWADLNLPDSQSIVATRLGCILAAEALVAAKREVTRTVFWHPVVSGSQFMTQFLRLQVAASMMEAGGQVTVDELRGQLSKGANLEVAGYELTPGLYQSVEQADLLAAIDPALGELSVVEVGRVRKDGLSPAAKKIVGAADRRGVRVSCRRVPGDPIWAATEIVTNSQLQASTLEHLGIG